MKSKVIILFLSLLTVTANAQNIGISSNGSTPNSSAMLDIDVSGLATKKGMLIPRVTAAEKAAMSPLPQAAQGLIVYQKDGVEGYYYNTSTTTTPSWQFLLPSGEAWGISGNSGTTAGTNYIGTSDAIDLVVKTNGSERMRFLSNGNIGIGVTVPTSKFQLQNTSSTAQDRMMNLNYTTTATGTTDSTSALYIRSASGSSGDITGAILHTKANGTGNAAGLYSVVTGSNSGSKTGCSANISGAGSGAGFTALVTNSSFTSTNYGGYYSVSGGDVNYGLYTNVGAGLTESYGLYVTGTPDYSAYLDQGIVYLRDSLSIGYSSAGYVPQYKLDVNGRINFTKSLNINGVAGNAGEVLMSNGANLAPAWVPGSSVSLGIWEEDAWGDAYNLNAGFIGINCTTPSEQLSVDGNIIATGNIIANDGFACASDRRYKKEIVLIDSSLVKLLQMRGVSYYWDVDKFPEKKFTEEKQVGFIAQEVEAIYPHMVFTDARGYKSVDYARLTPVLVEAMKELNSKVIDLEKNLEEEKKRAEKMQALENRIAILEKMILDNASLNNR